MKNDMINVICLDSHYQFFGIDFVFGYDVLYWYETDDDGVVCNKCYEPPFLHGFFNILLQLLPLIDGSTIFKHVVSSEQVKKSLEVIPEVSSSLEQSLQNSPTLQNIIVIPHDIFNSLLNLKDLTADQQIELFKKLYGTEAFQNTATLKYGSFKGFMEMMQLFMDKNLTKEYNEVLYDMITTVVEDYAKVHFND